MFELVKVGGRAGVLQSYSSICWGQGQFVGKDATQKALDVGVNSTHFLLTSGNFLLFLGKEARVKAT